MIMKPRHGLIALVAVTGMLAGCGRYSEPKVNSNSMGATNADSTSPKEVGEQYQQALKETGKLAEQTKDQFVASMSDKLDQLDQEMDQLGARAKSLKAEAKEKADQTLAALKQQRENVQKKLDELKAASKDAWADLRQGFASALDELGRAVDQAKKELG